MARSTAQTLVFEDGALDVRIESDAVLAGNQPVSETAASLATPLDPVPGLPNPPDAPPLSPNFFGIVLEQTPPLVLTAGTFATIIDAPGAQTFHIGLGASLGLEASAGTNTISLQANAADVLISRDVASISLSGPSGEAIAFTARSMPQTLLFLDGALDVRIDGNSVVAGDQAVTETPAPLLAALDNSETSIGIFNADVTQNSDLLLI